MEGVYAVWVGNKGGPCVGVYYGDDMCCFGSCVSARIEGKKDEIFVGHFDMMILCSELNDNNNDGGGTLEQMAAARPAAGASMTIRGCLI
ncbi:unnamed protein product [Cuscuta campestris]|uniref:Uncharacterized protein n=1 Tax=Cuscuta campestris TaxID=132261 RepID=A0A484MFI7_9ASTE|nr:unnamed protein product [Cuscuta campestris]